MLSASMPLPKDCGMQVTAPTAATGGETLADGVAATEAAVVAEVDVTVVGAAVVGAAVVGAAIVGDGP